MPCERVTWWCPVSVAGLVAGSSRAAPQYAMLKKAGNENYSLRTVRFYNPNYFIHFIIFDLARRPPPPGAAGGGELRGKGYFSDGPTFSKNGKRKAGTKQLVEKKSPFCCGAARHMRFPLG